MDKENGDNGGDKNKGGQPDPNSLLDAASLFGKCDNIARRNTSVSILTMTLIPILMRSLLGTRRFSGSSRGGSFQSAVRIAIRCGCCRSRFNTGICWCRRQWKRQRWRCWWFGWKPFGRRWWWFIVAGWRQQLKRSLCRIVGCQSSAPSEYDGCGCFASGQFGRSASSKYV